MKDLRITDMQIDVHCRAQFGFNVPSVQLSRPVEKFLDKSRVLCTKVLSQKSPFFQETSFYVLHVLLLDFTSTIWQLYIDFYTIGIVFKSYFQLCILKMLI